LIFYLVILFFLFLNLFSLVGEGLICCVFDSDAANPLNNLATPDANSADYIFKWNGCLIINIYSDSISDAEIQHSTSGPWSIPDTTIGTDSSRKTACFFCSEGHGPLTYSYGSGSDKFECENFACKDEPNDPFGPMNCGMHGSSEWFNTPPPEG